MAGNWTIYNEDGEVITDPQDRARILHGLLWSPTGPVIVYDDDGNEVGCYPPCADAPAPPPTNPA